MTLVLSSGSPRRRQLLEQLGISLIVEVPRLPEERREGETPAEFCLRVAREKALWGASRHPGLCSLGADTVVLLGEEILGKPRDEEEARRMLSLLSGKVHRVLSAFCLLNPAKNRQYHGVEETLVKFLPLGEAEIRWYVSTGEPMDKAGAYAIQGIGGAFVEWIKGSYTNVVGLPLNRILGPLKEVGIWRP